MLTHEEKIELLREFPDLKLSYEKIIHKKVYNFDLLLGIPDGKKCFAWFTSFNDKMLCILLELDEDGRKEFKHIKVVNACFSSSLCYGTLFLGTSFYHANNPFFAIEDIYLYKGSEVHDYTFDYKMNKIGSILKNEIKQISYNNRFVVFGLPLLAKSNEELNNKLSKISYKLKSINYYNFNKRSCFKLAFNKFIESEIERIEPVQKVESILPKQKVEPVQKPVYKKEAIFICKPDIQNDVYHLYSLDNKCIGLACIPDYKTSVMMNKLFRNIKENNDLDALEESDNEDEFENPDIDKFVYLERSYKMVCTFNNKFKKWTPVKITE